jgi:hypothetical protein
MAHQKNNTDSIVTMANLIYCYYYNIREHDLLVDEILSIGRFTLMMENIQGFILFNQTTNNFYFRPNDTTKQPVIN